jgi:putative endonuclease
LDNRIVEHNCGETKSLKSGIPWKIVFTAEVENRVDSVRLEKKIKNIGAKRFLARR